jgi:hypothetical protein
MAARARLDHTVINAGFEMDRAQQRFARLGFALTERGHHTLGSINHLMMFGSDYLELIGLPAGRPHTRPDIAHAPKGINGLVFKTADVDASYAHLQALGMAGEPPKSFSRPVRLAEGTFDARFRTVHLRADVFPGGRVYFCQHLTPELVWRPEWQRHANGAQAMPEFVVVAVDQAGQADAFARLLRAEAVGDGRAAGIAFDGGKVSVLTPAAYAERYGPLASGMGGRAAIFGAIVLRTGSLDAVREMLDRVDDVPSLDEPARVVLREPAFDAVLEFVA